MSNPDSLKVTRQDLYELVWSKPMVELARDLGLSDVGLAKHCRKLGIPTPGRGYWARVAAGQTPRQPPLKKLPGESNVQAAAYFAPPQLQTTKADAATDKTLEYQALRDRICEFNLPAAADLLSASAPIKRTAVALKRPWHRDIRWTRGERTGVVVQIDVSDPMADRALRFCEILLTGVRTLGWDFAPAPKPDQPARQRYSYVAEAPTSPTYGELTVEGERLAIRVDERKRQVDHVLSEEDKKRRQRGQWVPEPRWDLIPTRELRFHMLRSSSGYGIRTWKDRAKERLEDQVKAILLGLLDEAANMKTAREKERLAELERRRLEVLRWERQKRREANAVLIQQLEAQAGAWFRARLLRSYLRSLRRTTEGKKLEAQLQGMNIDFLEGAQHYVDQLDPLSSEPHDSDPKEDRTGYISSDEKVMKALARALGRGWQDAGRSMKLQNRLRK